LILIPDLAFVLAPGGGYESSCEDKSPHCKEY
jgi:hypothetical protein